LIRDAAASGSGHHSTLRKNTCVKYFYVVPDFFIRRQLQQVISEDDFARWSKPIEALSKRLLESVGYTSSRS
jgi:hypothetical protein